MDNILKKYRGYSAGKKYGTRVEKNIIGQDLSLKRGLAH
jgi:hypothetical protein